LGTEHSSDGPTLYASSSAGTASASAIDAGRRSRVAALGYHGGVTNRWDETWHRLREWTNGQAPSERLAAQVLLSDGYEGLDPSHPLGGPDGGKDAVCRRDGKTWVMAVYFPRGQQSLSTIKKKLTDDLAGVASNGADAIVFVTNQELTLGERDALKETVGDIPIDLFHLDRVTTILDQPKMAAVRKQFLAFNQETSVAGPLHRFLHICGMVRVQAPDWQAAQRECAQLYADLGGGPEAGYICTTAYVCSTTVAALCWFAHSTTLVAQANRTLFHLVWRNPRSLAVTEQMRM
jgi:hypothetical protein